MKAIILLIILIHLTPVYAEKKMSHWDTLKQKLGNRRHLITGCTIRDLEMKILRSYPGEHCVFYEDGSYASFDPVHQVFTMRDGNLRTLWSKNLHVHHEARRVSGGDLLINSSVVRDFNGHKNVRFDELILLGKDGTLKKRFSFYDYYLSLGKAGLRTPYRADWDKYLKYDTEVTHLASSFEIPEEMKNFAPKGGYLLTLNVIDPGVYVIDPGMKEIVHLKKVYHEDMFHDAQVLSSTELIFLGNNRSTHPKSGEEATVVIHNVETDRTRELRGNFHASLSGSVQNLGDGDYLIADFKGRGGKTYEGKPSYKLVDRVQEQKFKKPRILFFSEKNGIIHESDVDEMIHIVRLEDLSGFFKSSRGL